MEQLVPLLVQLVGGGAGGNIAGSLLKNLDLSRVVQTIVGIIGGIAGVQGLNWLGLLQSVLASGDAGGMLGQAGVSGVGGALLTVIVGMIKKAMAGGAAAH